VNRPGSDRLRRSNCLNHLRSNLILFCVKACLRRLVTFAELCAPTVPKSEAGRGVSKPSAAAWADSVPTASIPKGWGNPAQTAKGTGVRWSHDLNSAVTSR
jgi:hypothetical protein